jgi:hypothetical protein
MTIAASRALYIKIGEGNCWARSAFDRGTVEFGFFDLPSGLAEAAASRSDFSSIREFYIAQGNVPGTATKYSNEVREFYTADRDVLWITFADGRLWWTFAAPGVTATPHARPQEMGSRHRKTIGSWSDTDIRGQKLWINSLRGSLTTTAGFRGTICRVHEFDYLSRRINGQETEATQHVREARKILIAAIRPLIQGLQWRDFELLVELVMTQGGLRRVSETGRTQHTIDLELVLPLTGERALVQVKSELDQSTATGIIADLCEAAGAARVYVVFHTQNGDISDDHDNVTLVGPDALAERVVDLGLTNWVMDKVG